MKYSKLNTYFVAIFLVLFPACVIAGNLPPMQKQKDVRAQENDFYMYVNGPWLDSHSTTDNTAEISGYSEQSKIFKNIKNDCISNLITNGIANPIKEVYASLMQNNQKVKNLRLAEITAQLNNINSMNRQDILGMIAYLNKIGVPILMGIWVVPYQTPSGVMAGAKIHQEKVVTETIINVNLVKNTFALVNDQETNQTAAEVVELENIFNNWSSQNYPETLELTNKNLSEIWKKYILASNINTDTIITINKAYYLAVNNWVDSIALNRWQKYLKFRFLYAYRLLLLQDENAKLLLKDTLLSKYLVTEHDLAIEQISQSFGDELGSLCFYRDVKFREKKINEIIENLKYAYHEGINSATWMSKSTKNTAHAKLNMMRITIGYPGYPSKNLTLFPNIDPDNQVSNIMRINEWHYNYFIDKINKPLDDIAWTNTTIDASPAYDFRQNAIIVPLLYVLQLSTFKADNEPFNYGTLGVVIGHELGHAFDIVGGQYDELGNKKAWMNSKEIEHFYNIALKLRSQYSTSYVVGSDVSEDIADILGLAMAYRAYHISLKEHKVPIINDSSGNQLFYYYFAKMMRSTQCENNKEPDGTINCHSPKKTRVNGAIKNQPEFYDAYHIKPGDGMYLPEEKRIKFW